MYKDNQFYIAHGPEGAICINGKMANRHGLIAGATGTGKTVSLQVIAESFCNAGVPCFMADMKGDLSGISQPGKVTGFIEKRMPEFGLEEADLQFEGCPVRFYDVFGKEGHPMRTRMSNMGPLLLSRLLGLNDIQSGVLNIVFKVADERGLLLDDLKENFYSHVFCVQSPDSLLNYIPYFNLHGLLYNLNAFLKPESLAVQGYIVIHRIGPVISVGIVLVIIRPVLVG